MSIDFEGESANLRGYKWVRPTNRINLLLIVKDVFVLPFVSSVCAYVTCCKFMDFGLLVFGFCRHVFIYLNSLHSYWTLKRPNK
jgi:hypothetical protein